MIVVTGRIISELQAVFPDAWDHVDAIVAENGAVLATKAGVRLLAAPVDRSVSARLHARGVAHRSGQVLVACAAADEPAASEVIRELGLNCRSSATGRADDPASRGNQGRRPDRGAG